MNVAGYVRVSTDMQAEKYSIPQQIDLIKNYCAAKQWDLINIYTDAGYTGANMQRPQLQALIADIKAYDVVLVYKLDRLSRSQKDTLHIVEDIFQKNGVKFASIQENFDTSTPLGVAMLGILSTFAQLEREQIKERMSLGRRGRVKKGLWRAGSNVPTGYDYIDGRLVIRDDERVQIEKIFELFLAGWSIHKIKDYMHANYKNRYSSWAQASAVSTVLRNPLYIGLLPCDNGDVTQGIHDAIIDKETFDKVQTMLKHRAENFDPALKHPFKANHLLTGFIYCGECGGRVSCVGTHKYSYYGCHKKHDGDPRHKALPKCRTPKYNVNKLDALIIDQVKRLSYDDDEIKKLIKPRKRVDHSKAIKSLQKQKSRLIDLYAVGGIELTELTGKIDDITKRIEQLRSDAPVMPELSFADARAIFDNAGDVLDNATMEEKRAFLQSLIQKIVLQDNDILIYWRFS